MYDNIEEVKALLKPTCEKCFYYEPNSGEHKSPPWCITRGIHLKHPVLNCEFFCFKRRRHETRYV
jgi:hypothetical protein